MATPKRLLVGRIAWLDLVKGTGELDRSGCRYAFTKAMVTGAGFFHLYPGQVVQFSEVAGGGFPRCDRVVIE